MGKNIESYRYIQQIETTVSKLPIVEEQRELQTAKCSQGYIDCLDGFVRKTNPPTSAPTLVKNYKTPALVGLCQDVKGRRYNHVRLSGLSVSTYNKCATKCQEITGSSTNHVGLAYSESTLFRLARCRCYYENDLPEDIPLFLTKVFGFGVGRVYGNGEKNWKCFPILPEPVSCQKACNGNCCVGQNACVGFTGKICRDNSCHEKYSCFEANIKEVKGPSCTGVGSCNGSFFPQVTLDSSCTDIRACKDATGNGVVGASLSDCCKTYQKCQGRAGTSLFKGCPAPTQTPTLSPTVSNSNDHILY